MVNKMPLIAVVVPLFNEQAGIGHFLNDLVPVVTKLSKNSYQIICVDDGSSDNSLAVVRDLAASNDKLKVIALTRNFGKEVALSAGIAAADAQAIITLDADGQHPVELLPEFFACWQAGAKVVVGVRRSNQQEGALKRYGSKLFYGLYSKATGIKLTPRATDFRLIDHQVQREFVRLSERHRMTRALIDWLGYEQSFIEFDAHARQHGTASYSPKKLISLAINSVISHSLSPLYLSAYLGAIVLPLATLLGLGMVLNALIGDPLQLHATGGAYVLVLMLFLIGILLVSQGIIGLYLSHIHTETQNRPLYVIDKQKSIGVSSERTV